MAGTVGGGGIGDVAISYGYQRFDTGVIVITVININNICTSHSKFSKYISKEGKKTLK